MSFNPNATGVKDSGIFSLPYTYEQSKLILLPVPWEVTTSYGSGTSYGPASIYECSSQIDLAHLDTENAYQKGIFWQDKNLKKWHQLSRKLKPKALAIKKSLESGKKLTPQQKKEQEQINSLGEKFHKEVESAAKKILSEKKLLGTVGGDHSSPFGSICATSEFYKKDLTIIHIDAHADLRSSYQGYKHSHASILRNVMEDVQSPKKLIQLGIRDFCDEELEFIRSRKDIKTYFDRDLSRLLSNGKSWLQICENILQEIPTQNVYFSVDIDGFNPTLCPNTGTPVPGGLEFFQFTELLNNLLKAKKKIVGFDLCEVTPDSPRQLDCWDGNVGSRVLYNLCCYCLQSNS